MIPLFKHFDKKFLFSFTLQSLNLTFSKFPYHCSGSGTRLLHRQAFQRQFGWPRETDQSNLSHHSARVYRAFYRVLLYNRTLKCKLIAHYNFRSGANIAFCSARVPSAPATGRVAEGATKGSAHAAAEAAPAPQPNVTTVRSILSSYEYLT